MTDRFAVPANWYEDFFDAPVNAFWERVIPPEAALNDVAFLQTALAVAPPASILDIACGAGRHALALAGLGYRVTGIDGSSEAIARARSAGAGLPIEFVHGDMRELPTGEFDGAICMGNSFAYLDHDGTASLLRRISTALVPGGRLVIDSYSTAESILPRLEPDHPESFPGGTYEAETRYDVATSTLRTRAKLTIDGATRDLLYAHRIVTVAEMVRLLAEAGLSAIGFHADTDGAAFEVGAPRLLLVAERD